MTQFCLSSITSIVHHFSGLLLSDLLLFCSFFLSQPLYSSYFIFFSPYILGLISFLTPLFITTSLLLLALITISPGIFGDEALLKALESKLGFLHRICCTLLNTLQSGLNNEDVEFCLFEELQTFVLVLDTSSFETEGITCHRTLMQGGQAQDMRCLEEKVKEEVTPTKSEKNVIQGLSSNRVKVIAAKFNKCEGNGGELMINSKSEANSQTCLTNSRKCAFDDGTNNRPKKLGSSLESYGSMRKDNEWKRTLACKLYEERHNVDETEGMDLLWESYEVDSDKVKAKKENKAKKKSHEIEFLIEEDDDEESEDEINVQLCCLQALRFSTRKINLGFRKPNVKKISRALKGIGWLHHVGRHDIKGQN